MKRALWILHDVIDWMLAAILIGISIIASILVIAALVITVVNVVLAPFS